MKLQSNWIAILIPFRGVGHFLTHSYLWVRAVVGTLLCFGALMLVFTTSLMWFWPNAAFESYPQSWTALQALATSFLLLLALWFFFFPVVLAAFYEKMLKLLLLDFQGGAFREVRLGECLQAAAACIVRTVVGRIFWLALSFAFIFIFPPLAFVFAAIGFGVITLIDAAELVLTLQSVPEKSRRLFRAEQRLALLSGGVIAGFFALWLSITLIGWVFFIPSLYVGCMLWISVSDADQS